MPERDVFVRGLRARSGFRQVGVEYERAARAASETKYPLHKLAKLVKLPLDGVFAFSSLPLRLAIYLGFSHLAVSLAGAAVVIAWKILNFQIVGHYPSELPGWTSPVCLILFLGGMQFLLLGILGEFIRRIYAEVQQRPRWIIRAKLGFPPEAAHD